jgi:putative DNA primase/helicase
VFLNTLTRLLGDYATQAPMDMFTAAAGDRHPTDLASLQGARLVAANEVQAGRRWDEARMKSLTGGDPVAARFMRGDYFRYQPQFKLVFVGNHKPEIRDIDVAMRRRIHLIPFTVTPARVDTLLTDKLQAEGSAILGWMIEGCRRWRAGGLQPPAIVRTTTEDYFREEDGFGKWLEECTEAAPGHWTTTTELYESWRQWANQNGEYVGTAKRLVQAMTTRRFERWRDPDSRRRGFAGLRIRLQQEGVVA